MTFLYLKKLGFFPYTKARKWTLREVEELAPDSRWENGKKEIQLYSKAVHMSISFSTYVIMKYFLKV